MAEKINGRVAYADLLRSLAVIAAILFHLAHGQYAAVGVNTHAWRVLNVYSGLTVWWAPVFVMLSGMFLLDPKRGTSLSRLFLHNVLRVLLCLMFWGGVYAVVVYLCSGGQFSWPGLWAAMLNALKGRTYYHLWGLYVILGLYLVTPILRAFCRGASRGDFHYFFLLAFLFASALPMAFRVWPSSTAVIQLWYDRLQVKLVLGYVGYYVAGYYLKEYLIGRVTEALVYVLGVLGAIVTVWGSLALARSAGAATDTLLDYFSPNVVCFSVAIVVLFRYVLGVSEERSRRQRLSHVARIAFGVYLVHALFIFLLARFGVTPLSFEPAAAVPLLAAAVFLLSFALAWLLSKLPLIGRWLT